MVITLSDILGIILIAALGSYCIVGLIVVFFLSFRGPRIARRPQNGMLWEQKDNARNTWFWSFAVTTGHPITFVLHVLIWPFWFMSYLDSLEAEDEERPTQYLGPQNPNPPMRSDDA